MLDNHPSLSAIANSGMLAVLQQETNTQNIFKEKQRLNQLTFQPNDEGTRASSDAAGPAAHCSIPRS